MSETSMAHNRRRFERILFDAPCDIYVGDNAWSSQVMDISLKGVLVRRPSDWTSRLNDPFEITIHLNDQDTGIVMSVALRHIEDEVLGFQCQYIDLDSAAHLRRLVELNLGDPALLDRELRHLGEQR